MEGFKIPQIFKAFILKQNKKYVLARKQKQYLSISSSLEFPKLPFKKILSDL